MSGSSRLAGRVARPNLARNVATAAAILAGAYLLLATPARELGIARRARVGSRVVLSSDVATDLHGATVRLLANDSITMLVFVDTACERCRAETKLYVQLRPWAALQGIAVRLVAPTRAAAERFARTAYGDSTFLIASPAFFDRLGMRRMPSALFLDHSGVVRGRVIGAVPEEREILYTVDQNTGWGASGSWQFDAPTSVRRSDHALAR